MQETTIESITQPDPPPRPVLDSIQNLDQFLLAHGESLGYDRSFIDAVEKIPLSTQLKISAKEEFLKRSGYLIVPLLGMFYYYPMKLLDPPEGSSIFRIQKLPATVFEGFVIYSREIFYVTYDDLMRGVVRRSRKVVIPTTNPNYNDFVNGNAFRVPERSGKVSAATQSTRENSSPQEPAVQGAEHAGRTDGRDSVESIESLADMAFEEQIGALLGFED